MGEAIQLPMKRGFGATDRIDAWWKQPLWMAVALIAALVYTGLRVFLWDGDIHYDDHRVTSPIFSPDVIHIFGLSGPAWMNSALLVLWIPFGFRGTCYYMRRVYHRVFFQNPTGCVVAKPGINYRFGYKGETGLFVLNNIHRYMMYLAILIIGFKVYDVWHTMHFKTTDGSEGIGVSLGTLLLALEAFLLFMYVVTCHAFRHIIGGGLDRWDRGVARLKGRLFSKVSIGNVHHGFWFWWSLLVVFLGDIWVWVVASGHIADPILLMF